MFTFIDGQAYASRLRHAEPGHKAALALTALTLCLLLGGPLIGAITVLWLWITAWLAGGVRPAVFGRLLLAEGSFLLLASLGVVLEVQAGVPASDWGVALGGLWLGTSSTALIAGAGLILRALGCAAAVNLLALTTPLTDLLDLMRRLRLPPELISLTGIAYRGTFTLLESLDRIVTAQAARLGFSRPRRAMISAGLAGARLFVEAFQRAKRLEVGLKCRGGLDDLRVLAPEYHSAPGLLLNGALLALTLAWIGLVW